jgi:hypothetical protein
MVTTNMGTSWKLEGWNLRLLNTGVEIEYLWIYKD